MKSPPNPSDAASQEAFPEQKGSKRIIVDRPEKQSYHLPKVINKVIQGDSRLVLKKLPTESIDMVFMDPPYYLQLSKKKLKRWKVNTDVEGVDDDWDKFDSFEDYDGFIRHMFEEVRRIMKPAATIWVISTYHSLFRVGSLMQDMGFWILNDVHWVKTNPMPNWMGVRFTNATETLIWAVKDKKVKGHTFNREQAKAFGVGKVGANVWALPICTGGERLKNENGKKLHSTQKPLELLRRVILTSTNEGDVVLDPVGGVGTTAVAAKALGRRFITVEINPKYVEGAMKRLRKPPSLLREASKKDRKGIETVGMDL